MNIRLKVLYQDQEVKTDVTAVQVEVWNDGKESIRAENVLESIVIRTTPVVPIIDATIRKTRRALSSIELDRTQFSRGILPLSWRILENSDGAIIQIVYAGSADVKLDIFGTIEGQNKLIQITSRTNENQGIKPPSSNKRRRQLLAPGIAVFIFPIGGVWIFRQMPGKLSRFAIVALVGGNIIFYIYLDTTGGVFDPVPPLGF